MSALEDKFAAHVDSMRLPKPEREFRFHETRKWRFDFAWERFKIAVEIDGGVWSGGRHNTGAGMEKDMEKYNAATAAGWKVFRFSCKGVESGDAVRLTALALNKAAAER
jgi:very-short-patch-repair endonuclease